jgi:glyoxylase I family protein
MILEHVGLTISDLERSIGFYTEVLGFNLLRKTASNAYLYLGDQLLELTQCRAPAEAPSRQGGEECEERLYCDVGITHLGFRVDDMDQAVARIQELGGQLVRPPYEFEPQIAYVGEPVDEKLRRAAKPLGRRRWRIAIFTDPDGIILELLER